MEYSKSDASLLGDLPTGEPVNRHTQYLSDALPVTETEEKAC